MRREDSPGDEWPPGYTERTSPPGMPKARIQLMDITSLVEAARLVRDEPAVYLRERVAELAMSTPGLVFCDDSGAM